MRRILNKLVTVVIVNHRTPKLTERCFTSLLAFYSTVPVVLIDNDSGDRSTVYCRKMGSRPNATALLNDKNVGHGPALHQGIRLAKTPLVFTLDSDCKIQRGGFLERMAKLFNDNANLYAVGTILSVGRSGLRGGSTAYVHPYAMMIDRAKYLTLAPFEHHGAPCLRNMMDAARYGYDMEEFPVGDYVLHRGSGTRKVTRERPKRREVWL